jgi:hypothetical protein
VVKPAVLFPVRRLVDRYGPGGVKTGKALPLRETGGATMRASAPRGLYISLVLSGISFSTGVVKQAARPSNPG